MRLPTPAKETVLGTSPWTASTRDKLKSLVLDVDSNYMTLAKLLYEVWVAPASGDSHREPIYITWGYNSYKDWVEAELGIDYKKAQRLKRIWYRLEIEMKELDPELKRRIIACGWTKVREVIKVLTLQNAQEWAEKAERLNYLELMKSVKEYKSTLLDFYEPETMTKDSDTSPFPTPEPKIHYERFALFKDQLDNLWAALHQASKLSNKDTKSLNLDLICTDFLATNSFLKLNIDQRAQFLSKFCDLFGVDLVVVDRESKEIIMGIDVLEKLASE